MLGKFDTECPSCYEVNTLQLNKSTGMIKCVACDDLFKDMIININEEGKVDSVQLERLSNAIVY